jgi:LysM repeat protein
MNKYEAKFKFRGSKALSCLWARHAMLRRWVPHVGLIVLALVLVSAVTVLAAGSERAPDQLVAFSPLPTPTLTPAPTPSPTPVPSAGFYYTVRAGDTLSRIAWRFGTTVQAIVQANGIVNPNRIFAGQVFWIPSSGGGGSPGSTIYIVRRGDTLYSIARRFGTTYQALAALNGLRSPYTIYVGQRLVISGSGTPWPPPPPSQRVHIVRRGETLWSIALRYGTTPWAIAATNGLRNINLIYVGQRLIIP